MISSCFRSFAAGRRGTAVLLSVSKTLPYLAPFLAPMLFLSWYVYTGFQFGGVPFIPDSWSFPYNLGSLGYLEILEYFNRQPPGYLLYVKLMDHIRTFLSMNLYAVISLSNAIQFSLLLLMLYSLLASYVNRWIACVIACGMALGPEFHLYTLFTRYTLSTTFYLFALVYAHGRAFGDRFPNRRRNWWAAATLLSGLCLTLTRSFYLYFVFAYVGLLAVYALKHYGFKRPRSVSRLVPVFVAFLFTLGIPLALMANNLHIYGQFTLSSWVNESVQRNVKRHLNRDVLDNGSVQAFIQSSPDVPESVKKLYAAGLQWPTTRNEVKRVTRLKPEPLSTMLKTQFQPIEGIPKKVGNRPHLYFDVRSGNGYLTAALLEQGGIVAGALFRSHYTSFLSGYIRKGTPRAICYSGYFFTRDYGKVFCKNPPSLKRLWRNPLPMRRNNKVEYMAASIRCMAAHLRFVPRALTFLHLFLHRLLIPWILVGAFGYLLYSAVSLIRRKHLDPLMLLLAGTVVYSYLVGVLGDYYEAARYSVYWKLPAICLAVTGIQAARRILSQGLAAVRHARNKA